MNDGRQAILVANGTLENAARAAETSRVVGVFRGPVLVLLTSTPQIPVHREFFDLVVTEKNDTGANVFVGLQFQPTFIRDMLRVHDVFGG